MGTVTIGADSATIYGTLAGANSYLNLSLAYRARWNATAVDSRSAALVDATRYLEGLSWKADVTPSAVTAIVEASYMLAGFYVINPAGMGGAGGGVSNQGAVREVQDTTRRVAFHFSSEAARAKTSQTDALPRDILAKIKPYLLRGSTSGTALPVVTGTDGESAFTDDKAFLLES